MPYPYREWQPVHVFPFGEVAVRPGRCRPTAALVSTSLAGPDGERSGMQVMQVRVMQHRTPARRRRDAVAALRIRQRGARGLRVLARRPVPVRQFVLHGRVEHLPLRDRDRQARGAQQRRGGLSSGRCRSTSRNCSCSITRPQGFVPATIDARPTEDLSAITFLGEQIATERPVVQEWGAGPPSRVDYESKIVRQGDYSPLRELSARVDLPDYSRATRTRSPSAVHARFSDPLGFAAVNLTAGYSPGFEPRPRKNAATPSCCFSTRSGRPG